MVVLRVTAIPTAIAVPRAKLDAPAIATRRPPLPMKEEGAQISRLSADTVISEVKSVISTVQPIGHLYLR